MKRLTLSAMGLGLLLTPGAAPAQGTQADSAASWAAIVRCSQIRNYDERHACVEGVMRQAGLLNEEVLAQTAREEFGREDRRPRPAPPPPPPPPAAAAAAPQVAAAPPAASATEVDELVTTISAVRSSGYRRWIVTTAEGAMWEQTQAEDFTSLPKVGDTFTIERASFGSFRCRFNRSSLYRCQRSN